MLASRNFVNAPKNLKPEMYGNYSTTPLIRTLGFRIAVYPDRIDWPIKSVDNFSKLTYLKITGYRIKYSTLLWLLELQIGRGRKV
jgi:hypothetical protein